MAAGNPMEGEARPTPVRPADLDAGGMLRAGRAADFDGQFITLGGQLLHILPQLGRKRRFVQREPQDQRGDHPGEHRMELGPAYPP